MELLLVHCAGLFSNQWPLFITFFLAGFAGGFTHCIGMCGPFIICQTACQSSSCENKTSLITKIGLEYHIGRATTYGALGFFSAFLSKQVAYLSIWPWIAAFMLIIAGGMFIVSSLPGCKHSLMKANGNLTYVRGVLLGFLPCGLIYAALMMAATTANPVSSMVAMWLFVIGTVPALLLANWGAKMLTRKWQNIMQTIGRAVMVFNGLALFIMAIKLVR